MGKSPFDPRAVVDPMECRLHPCRSVSTKGHVFPSRIDRARHMSTRQYGDSDL